MKYLLCVKMSVIVYHFYILENQALSCGTAVDDEQVRLRKGEIVSLLLSRSYPQFVEQILFIFHILAMVLCTNKCCMLSVSYCWM
jgi:hypothetical protein